MPEQHREHRKVLDEAGRLAREHLDTIPERHVGARADRDELHSRVGGPLPEGATDPSEVLRSLAGDVADGVMASQSPRFFGFVMGGSHPVALGADWLTSTWDQNAALHAVSPGASVIEHVAGRWLLDVLHLPAGASVGFVTGGQMATWTCLAAARGHLLSLAGWDVEADGLHGAPRLRVVAGAGRHGTIDRALRFLGFGTGSIIEVPADDQGRIVADAAVEALEATDGPTILALQAGNVNSGSVDPMARLIPHAHRQGAWVHVDGAFGLWAQASRHRRHLTDGVELADSWSVDAHKWLNVPFDSGAAIVADPEPHQRAMGSTAAYLVHDDDLAHDQLNWNPEHSRRARGVPVWAVLRSLGRDGVEDLVDRLCDRARQFADLLSAADGVEVLNEVVLNQVLVRFTGTDDPDVHTRSVIERIQADGTCWMSGTTWQGQHAMRISVSNWATSSDDVDRSVDAILRCAGEGRTTTG
ncbi:MAG: pyridoxal phosphate-dependent decarboxylase family protein [Acidimicrobiales bacterium]